jgi:hypothetical protein
LNLNNPDHKRQVTGILTITHLFEVQNQPGTIRLKLTYQDATEMISVALLRSQGTEKKRAAATLSNMP